MLGITENPASALLTFGVSEPDIEIIENIRESEAEKEPATYTAALQSPQANEWKEAMRQEWQVLIENHTFDVAAKGIDYDESYVPVSKMATFRLLLAHSAQHGGNVDHMDVVTAFLNPKIDRDNIQMAMPLGID